MGNISIVLFSYALMSTTSDDHGELCLYLDEWLRIFDELWHKNSQTMYAYGNQAREVSNTLSDLIVIDALKAGI